MARRRALCTFSFRSAQKEGLRYGQCFSCARDSNLPTLCARASAISRVLFFITMTGRRTAPHASLCTLLHSAAYYSFPLYYRRTRIICIFLPLCDICMAGSDTWLRLSLSLLRLHRAFLCVRNFVRGVLHSGLLSFRYRFGSSSFSIYLMFSSPLCFLAARAPRTHPPLTNMLRVYNTSDQTLRSWLIFDVASRVCRTTLILFCFSPWRCRNTAPIVLGPTFAVSYPVWHSAGCKKLKQQVTGGGRVKNSIPSFSTIILWLRGL